MSSLHTHAMQSTPFVGREVELAKIAALLGDPACRLLTLVGPGGIGKTRLALKAAQMRRDNLHHDIHIAFLQPLTSPDFLVTAIADSVNFRFYPGGESRQQILDYLRDKAMLLVLDNLEHLLDGVELLSGILSAAPRVRMLTTSRERLNLLEEWVLEVGGLSCPAGESDANSESYAAVQLFLQHARRVHVGYKPTPAHMSAITRICQLVGGMPLGIELAAAWVRALPVTDIAHEIERSLDILQSSARNVEPRHRSMRAAFEPTWNRLSDEERDLFARLSVFRGGFDLAAAIQVADATLVTLSVLVDKSLLHVDEYGRYDLHELLRQYADEQLRKSGDAQKITCEKHCHYYAEFLRERAESIFQVSRSYEIVQEIDRAIENIRAAWQWAIRHARLWEIQAAVSAMTRYYYIRNSWQEAVQAFQDATDQIENLPSTEDVNVTRTTLLVMRGFLYVRLGRIEEARRVLDECTEMFSTVQSLLPPTVATPVNPFLAASLVANISGDYAEAVRLGEIARQHGETRNDRIEIMFANYVLTGAYLAQGRYQEAKASAERACTLAQAGDRWMLAYCLNERGNVARALGQYDEAIQHYRESFAIRQDYDDKEGMAAALSLLADLASFRKEFREAGNLYRQSLDIYQEMGDRGFIANAYNGLGITAYALGDYQEARQSFCRALQAAQEAHLVPHLLTILLGVGEFFIGNGQPERAAELLLLAIHHPTSKQETRDKAQAMVARYQHQISPNMLAAAEARVQFRELETAVQELLAELRQPAQPFELPAPQSALDALTFRELDVLRLLAAGLTNRQIAETLVFTEGTVKWYLNQIYSKLHVGSRTQAIIRARELKLIP